MNTTMSKKACAAVERIRTLREITKTTGLTTTREQFDVLMHLNNADALIVAEATKVTR